jgi:hypothetical protein
MVSPKKKMYMRCPGIFLFLALIACIFIAGCTQVSGTSPVPPQPTTAPVTPVPAEVTAVPTAAVTVTPETVVTIVHYIPLVKDVKDSKLLFLLQVPVEWTPSTYRLENPENYEGFMYQTDLVKNNSFYIHTYENYRNRDQNYRDEARGWVPAPNMSVVTINGITFDRFESTANGTTRVTYVSRQTCMNDYGYLSVLAFSADTSNRFAVEDYERVVASFRYYSSEKVSTMPGEEIPRILPDEGDGGSVKSAFRSGSSSSPQKSSGGCALSRK